MNEIYQQRSQSKSFNGNDLMVLFNWGWSHLINKLSLIRSLNLFASEAGFPVKLEIPMCSEALVKKCQYVLP